MRGTNFPTAIILLRTLERLTPIILTIPSPTKIEIIIIFLVNPSLITNYPIS